MATIDEMIQPLYAVVREGKKAYPNRLWSAINTAHCTDVADGLVFKREHLGLLRVYRNSVSNDPQHLIDAATTEGTHGEERPLDG